MNALRGIELSGAWKPQELRVLKQVLEPLPAQWLEDNPRLARLAREPVLRNAPADAPGHSKYDPKARSIVVYDKGVYHGEEIDPIQFRRSIYHELAHTILEQRPEIRHLWRSQTSKDGFVDEYARTSVDEDFADTLSEYLIDRNKTKQRVPKKAGFIAKLLSGAQQEKVAMFVEAFADEMVKMAKNPLSALLSMAKKAPKKAGRTPGKVGVGKALAIGGAGSGGAYLAGKSTGQSEGSADKRKGMAQAYQLGVRRGATAMHQMILQRMQAAQK